MAIKLGSKKLLKALARRSRNSVKHEGQEMIEKNCHGPDSTDVSSAYCSSTKSIVTSTTCSERSLSSCITDFENGDSPSVAKERKLSVRFDERRNRSYKRPGSVLTLEECEETWYSKDDNSAMKVEASLCVWERVELYRTWLEEPTQAIPRKGGRLAAVNVNSNKEPDVFNLAYMKCRNNMELSDQEVLALKAFLDDDATGLETNILKYSIASVNPGPRLSKAKDSIFSNEA